jgi:Fe-S cluster biogenesis protein NfuA
MPTVADITCPRCRSAAQVRYYGPCESCRDALRTAMVGVAREVEAAAFEPAMHVTPNAVALKDD